MSPSCFVAGKLSKPESPCKTCIFSVLWGYAAALHTVTVDTLAAAEALRKGNKFTKEQAKAIVETIRSVELHGMATSSDIQWLERVISKLEKSTSEDIQGIRNEMHNFRAEIFKWGGLLIIGQYALGIGILLKLFGAL